ncbi:Uu.00g130250.m01.CDS01 [Anthostomella pinea]|uniref:Uu.00g130250.m01.CDS01 n=1 Tax=Anthostomella pinea TaxID=933095 RepID=A0AAI8VJ93_9PEZI|nr:Uu.00g130250.m01.CDS01 [Anthostomella pinea]
MQASRLKSPHWVTGLSILVPVVAFVLASIALFAGTGSHPKQLEEYHMISRSLSALELRKLPTGSVGLDDIEDAVDGFQGSDDDGKDDITDGINEAIDSAQGVGDNKDSNADSITNSVNDAVDSAQGVGDDKDSNADNITGGIGDAVNSFRNETVDDIGDLIGNGLKNFTEAFHLPQWYSLHVTNYCKGLYAPNATVPHPRYNTTDCGINVSRILTDEFPVLRHASIADFPLDAVYKATGYINSLLLAVYISYIVSCVFCGLSILFTVATSLRFRTREWEGFKKIVIAHVVIAGLAGLSLAVASVITTLVAVKGASGINDAGKSMGISARGGTKLLAISWAACTLMFANLVTWGLFHISESR